MKYPVIDDPEHPLYEQAQEGWPDFNELEAWREVARDSRPTRANSSSHPAFGKSYIQNDQAEREAKRQAAEVDTKSRR